MKQASNLFAQDIFWTTGAALSQSVFGFLLVLVFMRVGGSESYGVWSVIVTISTILSTITTLRLSSAMVRMLSGSEDVKHKENVFFLMWIISMILSLVFVFILSNWDWFITSFFGNEPATNVRIGLLFIFAHSLELIMIDALRTFNLLPAYALNTLLRTAIPVLLVFSFANQSLATLFSAVLIFRVGIVLMTTIYIIRTEQFSLTRFVGHKPSFAFLKVYLPYSFPLLVGGLFLLILQSGDRLVLSYFTDLTTVGIYSASYMVSSLGILLVAPVQMSVFGSISRLWNQGQITEAQSYVNIAFSFYVVFALPLTILITMLADLVLALLKPGMEDVVSYQIVGLIASATFFYGLFSIALLIVMLSNKLWPITIVMMISGIANIALNLWLIGLLNMNILGAALSTLIVYSGMTAVTYLLSRPYLTIRLPRNLLMHSAIAAIILVAGLFLVQNWALWERLLIAIGLTAIYFLWLITAEVIPKKLITENLSLVRKRVSKYVS
jgi:stage V sporulation protein B